MRPIEQLGSRHVRASNERVAIASVPDASVADRLLLPYHLPLNPYDRAGRARRCNRTYARHRLHAIAWELTEMLLASFILNNIGIPKDPEQYSARMGPWKVTEYQHQAILHMRSTAVRFCRPHIDISSAPGRGQTVLNKLLDD